MVNLDAPRCTFRLYLNALKATLPVRDAQAPTALPSRFLAKSNSCFLDASVFIRKLAPEKVIVEAIRGIQDNMQPLNERDDSEFAIDKRQASGILTTFYLIFF